MYRNGRGVDQNFNEQEKLYIRFTKITNDGKVDPLDIRSIDTSVNRSKYSKGYWVILPNNKNWGYGSFAVLDIPTKLSSDHKVTVTHEFKLEHDPKDDNYSHSEIRGFKQGNRVKNTNKTITWKYRVYLSTKIKINKLPD
jgi:hypothetical protein